VSAARAQSEVNRHQRQISEAGAQRSRLLLVPEQ
jgi:hypothetical protein